MFVKDVDRLALLGLTDAISLFGRHEIVPVEWTLLASADRQPIDSFVDGHVFIYFLVTVTNTNIAPTYCTHTFIRSSISIVSSSSTS